MSLNLLAIDRYDASRDSLDEITALLHQAYAKLAAMGFNYVAATQDASVTAKRLQAGDSYVARVEGQLVGVISYYESLMPGFSEPPLYGDKDACHFGQFAVLPGKQNLGVGRQLLEYVENHAQSRGKKQIACDTAEGATHLLSFYEKRGYSPAGYHQWAHACYRSIILCKALP